MNGADLTMEPRAVKEFTTSTVSVMLTSIVAALLIGACASESRAHGGARPDRMADGVAIHLPIAVRSAPVTAPAEAADFVLGGPAWAIDVVDDVAFVGVGAHLVAYDVSRVDGPIVLGMSRPLPGNVRDVIVRDGVAFTAVHQASIIEDQPGGLFVLDVSDPTSITEIGAAEIHGGATRAALHGDRIVLLATEPAWSGSGRFTGIAGFDVANPKLPIEIGTVSFEWDRGDVEIIGRNVYLCNRDAGLVVVDLEASEGPGIVSAGDVPCDVLARADDDTRLLAVSEGGSDDEAIVRVLDVTEPASPIEMAEAPLFDPMIDFGDLRLTAVHFDGTRAVVTGWDSWGTGDGGLIVEVDLTRMAEPAPLPPAISDTIVLGVSTADRRVIAVGASDAAGTFESAAEGVSRSDNDGSELGSAMTIMSPGVSGTSIASNWILGPGTVITVVGAHAGVAYAIEISSIGIEVAGRLWAIDFDHAYPRMFAPLALENARSLFAPELDALHEPRDAVAASEYGLFVASDPIEHFRVVGGRLTRVGTFGGADVVESFGGLVYGAGKDSGLTIYDISGTEPRRISGTPLPTRLPDRIALASGLLWVATWGWDGALVLFDVRDSMAPRLIETVGFEDIVYGEERNGGLVANGRRAYLLKSDDRCAAWCAMALNVFEVDEARESLRRTAAVELEDEFRGFRWGARGSGLAVLGSQLWIARGFSPPSDRHLAGSVIEFDVSDPVVLGIVGERASPAAVRARLTAILDPELTFTPGAIGLETDLTKRYGSVIGGGLYTNRP